MNRRQLDPQTFRIESKKGKFVLPLDRRRMSRHSEAEGGSRDSPVGLEVGLLLLLWV